MTDTIQKTKETSVLDFTDLSIQGLDEMENEVASLFPNDKDKKWHNIGLLHAKLLHVLSFRCVYTGWEKKELIEMFTGMVDDSLDEYAEFKKP